MQRRNWEQFLLDKLSIGLSVACTVHCITMPLLVILLPSFWIFDQLNDHSVHKAIAWIAVPTSAVAAYLGYRYHKVHLVPMLTGIGAIALLGAAFFGHDALGGFGEKIATVFAGSILAFAHWRNFSATREISLDLSRRHEVRARRKSAPITSALS